MAAPSRRRRTSCNAFSGLPAKSWVGAAREMSAFSSPLVRVAAASAVGAAGAVLPVAAPISKFFTLMEYVSAALHPWMPT